jgi:predicted PurR-regulated permease PerM
MAPARENDSGTYQVPRLVSFIVLLAIVLLVGAVFFKVMAQFIVPLFLACVLLVVFQPLHLWFERRLPGHRRVSALLTTSIVVLVVLLPTIWLGWNAYRECAKLLQDIDTKAASTDEQTASAAAMPAPKEEPAPDEVSKKPANESPGHAITARLDRVKRYIFDQYRNLTGKDLDGSELVEKVTAWTAPWLLSGLQTAFGMLIGMVIMVVALYYFFADGPSMAHAAMQISPLDERYELELLAQFAQISRSVVVATMLSAATQGIAAGIGYYVALPSSAPVFLLTAATMVLAIVPFVGAAGIWVPVCIGYVMLGGDWAWALGLAVYCGIVVSTLDNVIKPYVLHGQANLHPLLALLSILGGATVLGPIGILVGPMIVAFLQALLKMFQKELDRLSDPTHRSSGKLSARAAALADSIEAAVEAEAEAHDSKQESPPPNKSKTTPGKKAKSKKAKR